MKVEQTEIKVKYGSILGESGPISLSNNVVSGKKLLRCGRRYQVKLSSVSRNAPSSTDNFRHG